MTSRNALHHAFADPVKRKISSLTIKEIQETLHGGKSQGTWCHIPIVKTSIKYIRTNPPFFLYYFDSIYVHNCARALITEIP